MAQPSTVKRFILHDFISAQKMVNRFGAQYDVESKLLTVFLVGSDLYDTLQLNYASALGAIPEEEVLNTQHPDYLKQIHGNP